MLRVHTTLSDETEDLVTKVIGCCIAVHRALGPGLLEMIYSRAVSIEFDAVGLGYVREKEIPVFYRGQLICRQRLDIVVADQVLLEVKAVEQLASVHHAQVLSYLRVARLRVGLLINFNVPVLKDGIRRVVL